MSSAKRLREESVLASVSRRAVPVLALSMIGTTGVAVVLGVVSLFHQVGAERIPLLVREYFWIIFWTGLAEGVALTLGLVAFFCVARKIARPLVDLSQKAEEFTRTGRPTEFPADSPVREINQLSATLNDLIATRERQTREIRDLTRNVLHDLRTPLTHIRNNAELLHAGKADTCEASEKIAEACDALLGIVDLNSEISLNYAGAETVPAQDEDLSAIVETLCDMYSAVADARNVVLEKALPESPVRCFGHKVKLQQLVANLLDNALKYTPAGGTVRIELGVADNGVRLRVSDTGVGISAEDLDRIYDRFYRAKDVRRQSGNGLGLSLVHAIVTFYRGTIDCSSEKGKGTAFAVTLPLRIRT